MNFTSVCKGLALAVAVAAVFGADAAESNSAMIIGYPDNSHDNAQERVAADFFVNEIGGQLITPAEISKIDASKVEAIWIHIDRTNLARGWQNLPAAFISDEMISALRKFVEDGGNLYLSKYATQLIVPLQRVDAQYAPNIVSEGSDANPANGGPGTDVWTVNAHLGYWKGFLAPEEERDMTQVYDRRTHAIYNNLTVWPAKAGVGFSEFETDSYAMLGTGNGSEMHREDHNCMWDLNAYQYTADGRNTMEKFEAQNNCVILGTWGHVIDFAVAGIIDFNPTAEGQGRIVANGLAACEWAPRSGANAYHRDLKQLTTNTMSYLARPGQTGVEADGIVEADEAPAYYNLQGVRVENPAEGLYIKVAGGKATKVLVK